MKIQKKAKKLELNRETVRQISDQDLNRVDGGAPETWTWFCPSNPTIC